MNENKLYKETDNPVFLGKRLDLPAIRQDTFEQGIINRAKNTVFCYSAWPSVCRDDSGVLYATSSAFGTAHVCPFSRYTMYISRDEGKTWTPPTVISNGYLPQGHGGIISLGNGKLLANRFYHPGDVLYQELYTRINDTMYGGSPNAFGIGLLRQAMVDLYPRLPVEEMIGGSYVMLSDDAGVTWSDQVRVPVWNVHGACLINDGTVMLVGKECYADPSGTRKAFNEGYFTRFHAKNWDSYVAHYSEMRMGKEFADVPIYACVSADGGVTWEKRAMLSKPDSIEWGDAFEPYAITLPNGEILCAIRVEKQIGFENDYTVYLTRSKDNGYTWSEWECTHIPGSPAHLLLHSSGALVCSVGLRMRTENGIYAYISHDFGKTWEKKYELSLSDDSDLGYPMTVELSDHRLLTVFYQHYVDPETGKKDGFPSILYTKWEL